MANAVGCMPTAELLGPDNLVGEVATILIERGISTTSLEGCGFTRVTLTTREDGILLTIQHGDRQVERRATAATGVATIVESWVRSDLATAILNPDPEVAASAAAGPPEKKATQVAIEVSVLPTVGLADDNSVWTSISGGFCVNVTALCAGIWFHVAQDTDLSGPGDRLETERRTYEVMLVTDVDFHMNGFQLRPGAGIGIGWTHRRTDYDEVPATESVAKVVGGLRLELRLLAMLALSESLNLVWALVADYAPMSKGTEMLSNGLTLAADPRWLARVGIGLSYEF